MNALFLPFLLICHLAMASAQTISGDYGDLQLAYDKEGLEITGIYSKSIDENPECSFAFSGKLKNQVAQISGYSLHDRKLVISGALSLLKTGEAKINLASEPDFCRGPPFFSDKRNPAIFRLKQAKNILYLRVLRKSNPNIYQEPKDLNPLSLTWVSGEIFIIIETRVGWVKILQTKKNDYSWMKESDFFPLFESDLRDQPKP